MLVTQCALTYLTEATLLRSFASEHGPKIVVFLRQVVVQPLCDESSCDPCCSLWAHGQSIVAFVNKCIEFLPDNV